MKPFGAIIWFRILVLMAGFSAGVQVFLSERGNDLLSYVILVLGALFLWLFSDLCTDIRHLRNRLDGLGAEESHKAAPSSAPARRAKDPSEVLLEMNPLKRLGDRVFKADATKTCQSCKWFRDEEKTCALDGVSLQGITVGAVGCQHWAPGLRVTSSEHKHPSSESEPPPLPSA